MADEEQLPTEIEVNFEKHSLYKLYQTGDSGQINPERWERVRREIRFEDVVADLTGHSGSSSIRCPFHGSDSTPSFWMYRGSNDGWCFGCPPKQQYYDQVRFVSRYLDISRTKALRWLERKWELPFIADLKDDDEDEITTIQLKYEDLQEPYIQKAIKQVQEFKDVELAEDYIKHYFIALNFLKLSEEARRQGEIEDAVTAESKAAITLAKVLGKKEIDTIFVRKQSRA